MTHPAIEASRERESARTSDITFTQSIKFLEENEKSEYDAGFMWLGIQKKTPEIGLVDVLWAQQLPGAEVAFREACAVLLEAIDRLCLWGMELEGERHVSARVARNAFSQAHKLLEPITPGEKT